MQKNNKNTIDDLLLIRYIIGDITDDERIMVDKWIKESSENELYFKQLEDVWGKNQYSSLFDEIDVDKNWNKIQPVFQAKAKKIKTRSIRTSFVRISAAAVFLGFAIFSAIYFFNTQQEPQQFMADSKQELSLPDGSSVLLNENSSLTYPKSFKSNERKVELKGEAYFDIEKDESKPFVIDVNESCIKVLGTSFSVDGTNPDKVYVNVIEGKVRFFDSNDKKNFVDLDAGKQGVFNLDTRQMELKSVINQNRYAWKTDTLVFSQTPLKDVFVDFKKFFKKEFLATNLDIENFKLSSKFCNPNLADVLSEICVLYDFNCEISRDTVYFYKDNQ